VANTKAIFLVVLAVILFGLLVCGGGAAVWYFKLYRTAAAPDVGPMPGHALALPAGTAAAGGLDVKAFFASAAYKQMLEGNLPGASAGMSPSEAEQAKKQIKEGLEKGLQEAEDKTGIRLDRDLDRVVFAATNAVAQQPEGALIALGRFDRAKVTKAVEASAKAAGVTVTSKTVEGLSVLLLAEPGKPGGAFAVDDTVIVVGTAGAVETVVTNHAKRARPLEANVSLLDLVKRLEPTASYWLVIDQPLIERIQKEAGGSAPPAPLPSSLTLAGKYQGGLEVVGEWADAAAAKSAADMLQQGLEMAKGLADQSPDVQKVPGAGAVLGGVQVKLDAKRVTLVVPGTAGGGGLAGMAAAVAIPNLLQSRVSANEAAAIADIRNIVSAEAVFSSSSGGWYGDLACLAAPKGCIDGYDGPGFILDAALAGASEKNGYKRAFHRGPSAGARGYQGFAYTATPAAPGQTGVRSFCGDASGFICSDASGAEILPQAGACPRDCAALDGGAPPPLAAPRPPIAEAPLWQPPPPTRPAPRTRPQPVTRPQAQEPTARTAPAPANPPRTQALRVGGEVREPRKVKHVDPIYPPFARQARVQGVVILEASISVQGRVTDVRVLRGVPLLDPAAIEAVQQWRYEPTLLNGVPEPVIMTVTVNFKLR